MNIKRLVFWGLLFSILLVYAMLFEQRAAQEVDIREEKDERVLDIKPDEISTLVLTRNAQRCTLTRAASDWKIEPTPARQITKELIQSILTSCADTVVIDVIDANAVDLAPYGLDHPSLALELGSRNSTTPFVLLLGNETPTGVSMYALVKGTRRVVKVGTYLRFSINMFLDKIFAGQS